MKILFSLILMFSLNTMGYAQLNYFSFYNGDVSFEDNETVLKCKFDKIFYNKEKNEFVCILTNIKLAKSLKVNNTYILKCCPIYDGFEANVLTPKLTLRSIEIIGRIKDFDGFLQLILVKE